jgi:hypothetical protein
MSKYSIPTYVLRVFDYTTLTFSFQLFAKGGEDGPEYNRAHRLVNAWEFAKLTRQAAERGRYVIAVRTFLCRME